MSKITNEDYKALFTQTDNYNSSLKNMFKHLNEFEDQTLQRLFIIEQYLHLLPKIHSEGLQKNYRKIF